MTALAGTWPGAGASAVAARAEAQLRSRPPAGSLFLFAAALAGYLGLGLYLALALHAMHGDAYSRVTNASYVFFSRDPHLAAIGFVWPPLPTLFELALVPLRQIWPPMVESGVAAVIMSAVFMAGAVYELDRALVDFGVRRAARLLLVASFALHPMVVYYGAIGTSEAPTIFFLVLAARHLARWIRGPAVDPLVIAGIGLACAYLTRYEAMFSAAGAGALVFGITLARSRGTWHRRVDAAFADAAILVAPFALAFAAWALASWLIVGSPFTQFTSAYGNAAQIGVAASQSPGEQAGPLYVKAGLALDRLGGVELALPAAIGLAALIGRRRRDDRWLALCAVVVPALAFMIAGYLTNTLFPWLRFYILAVPLGVMLAGLAVGGLVERDGSFASRVQRPRTTRIAGAAVVAAIVGIGLVSVPVAWQAMLDPTLAVEESKDLAGLLGPNAAADDRAGADLRTFATERDVAAYLDALHLPRGSVVVDAFSGFAVIARSTDPTQFVITPDEDFRAVLADPRSFGGRYLLAPGASGNGVLDAVNVAYPALLRDGAGIATLVRVFPGRGGSSDWSLYRLIGS